METRRFPGTILALPQDENGMLVRFDGYDDDDEDAEAGGGGGRR